MKEKCPFKIGDMVIYNPSRRGYDLVDGERLEIGKEYRVSMIEQDSYIVAEGYDHPGGGIYWTEFEQVDSGATMNKVQVRCWKVPVPGAGTGDHLLITYPEGHYGHSLLSCLNCGEVYAVTVAKETYVGPPLKQKLSGLKCIKCGELLESTAAPYPDKFREENGTVCVYIRDKTIPDDEDSLIVELPDIYS